MAGSIIKKIPASVREELAGCFGNIVAGIRLALFLPVKTSDFRISWHALWFVFLVYCAVNIVESWFLVKPPRSFWAEAGMVQLWIILVFLIPAYVASLFTRSTPKILNLCIVVLNGILLAQMFQWARLWFSNLDRVDEVIKVNAIALIWGWRLLIAYRAVGLSSAASPLLRVVAAVILLAGLYGGENYSRYSYFWYHDYSADKHAEEEDEGEDSEEGDQLFAEDLLQSQHTIVAKSLKALKPPPSSAPVLYGIVMGSNSAQDVFMKETKYVSGVLEHSMGMKGRIFKMINNPETYKDIPLATSTNLQEAMNAVAGHMRSDDALVLYITSHGGKDSGIQVQMQSVYGLHDITGKSLAGMLDKAKIKHRIVIVSACYSGQVIDDLKNPNTVVITAADKDHTSFGCGRDFDLTYFAEAYFQDALPKSKDFLAAFDEAKKIILERETREKIPNSNPQIFIGENMKAVLERYKQK